jgi:hypothetical protein
MTERLRIPFPAPDTGTVAYWRSAAQALGRRSWRGAVDAFALEHGQAVAMLANDSALVVTRAPTAPGGLHRATWPPHLVTWTRPCRS